MAKKHVFPLFLDGDIQAVAASGAWNGLTSRIDMNGAFILSAPSDVVVEPGTIVSLKNDTGGSLNLTLSPDPFGDADTDVEAIADKTIFTVLYVSDTIGWIPFGIATLS